MPQRSNRNAYSRHVVTAVVVLHDGARWLPDVITGLHAQLRPPQRVVAVDTGSTDTGPALARSAFGDSSVVSAPRDAGFGTAVQLALDALAGAPALPTARRDSGEIVEWIWLLHDDCAPEPTALTQ